MPLQIPTRKVTLPETDQRLAAGQRRTGEFVYRTRCPECRACEPIRVLVDEFQPSRTHRRTALRNQRALVARRGPVQADEERLRLFNEHRRGRDLGRGGRIDLEEYAWAFQRTCLNTVEMTYWLGSQLCCVAITDLGADSVSAVYTYFDTAMASRSLGTYALLKQIDLCRETGRRYLYLGFYIRQSPHMIYKANFVPHERLIGDRWRRFDKRDG